MYPINLNFPGTAVISLFTQTMGFESGITAVQARSVVDDRFAQFSLEAGDFLKNKYKHVLIERLKKQKDDLDKNIGKLKEDIFKLREIRDDPSSSDQSAVIQTRLMGLENEFSFLKGKFTELETVLKNTNSEIDNEVAKKQDYINSLLKNKPYIVELSLSKKDKLKELLRDRLSKEPNGINVFIVSASIGDRAHWFNVLRIGDTVNIADAAGDSLKYLTQTYVEDSKSFFKYNYNARRLQYSSGCCETFAIELPFYWLRLWTFNDKFESVVFEDSGFPKVFDYFDEFAFGRIQPKKSQAQISVRDGYMVSLKKDLDKIGNTIFFGFDSSNSRALTFKDIFDTDFNQSILLLGQLDFFPKKEENVDIPSFIKLGHILFQTQRNIEYYNRGFSRLIVKRLPADIPLRRKMLESIQTKTPTAIFYQNKSDPLYKAYNEIESMYGLNGSKKNIDSIMTFIQSQAILGQVVDFGIIQRIVAWNEDFREDVLAYFHKNKSATATLYNLFFEGQSYVSEVIKKYEIFDEVEQQQSFVGQQWVNSIFPKTIDFIRTAEGSDKNSFVSKFTERVLDVSLREGFFESLSIMNPEEQDVILDEIFYENQRLARVRLQKASLLKDINKGIFDRAKIVEATSFIKKTRGAIRNSTVTGISTQETSDTEDLSNLEEELYDFIDKVEKVNFTNLPTAKSPDKDTWDSFEKTIKETKDFFSF